MNTGSALAYLQVIAPDGVTHAVSITQFPFCIGRAEHNDLMLAEEHVSRHHACLRREGEQIHLVDMGSENGTWIGAARLEANRSYALADHQTFRIGSYQLRLEPSSAAPFPTGPTEETIPGTAIERELEGVQAATGSARRAIEPLVQSSLTGGFGVALKTPEIFITPGASTNASLIVINQSQSSDGFRITLSGIPQTWLPAPPPQVELPPGARQEVNLTIHPSRQAESHAGSYRLRIQVSSQDAPTETVEVWAVLTVTPYTAFSSALHPPRTGPRDTAQVIVRNLGNAPEVFMVTWSDPEDRYEFRPAEMRMTLAPGETATAEFRAIPHWRRLLGGPLIDVYSVKITPGGGQPQTHTGQIVTTGLIPMWAATLLFLLIAVCTVGTGAVAMAMLEPTSEVTPTPTGSVTPTISATMTPAVTGTMSGLDSDGDGLTDEEEARFGTDPRAPDTDRDGLSDYDEVRRGTSPILADTDGDTLLDGQEAIGCSDPRNPDTDGDGQRDNIDPDPCRLPTPTQVPPTATPVPTVTPPPTQTPFPTATPLPTSTPLPTTTPLPPPTLPPIITEWYGEYFGNSDLLGTPLVVRNDPAIDFNWMSGPPDPLVPADHFSARWTRTVNFENRMYRLSIWGDDGLRVFVDNNLVINEWHAAATFPPTYTVDVNLIAGPHTLRVEYYEATLDAYVRFQYELLP